MSATGARVRRLSVHLLRGPGKPLLLVNCCASLPCGCACYVGRRVDNQEAATGCMSCSPIHSGLIEHFNLLLMESLAEPLEVSLVDVCARLLDEARRHWRPE